MNEKEVTYFEKQLGADLPKVYRKFLLEIGGVAIYEVGVRPIERREPFYEDWLIEILYGGADDKPYDLWSRTAVYKDRIPGRMIPIGENLFGDQFCLAIQGPDRGKIYFWSHDDFNGSSD